MITFLAHVMCTSLMSVLAALQFYRNDCSRGTVSIQSHQKTNFVPESLTLSFLFFLKESFFHFEGQAQ